MLVVCCWFVEYQNGQDVNKVKQVKDADRKKMRLVSKMVTEVTVFIPLSPDGRTEREVKRRKKRNSPLPGNQRSVLRTNEQSENKRQESNANPNPSKMLDYGQADVAAIHYR